MPKDCSAFEIVDSEYDGEVLIALDPRMAWELGKYISHRQNNGAFYALGKMLMANARKQGYDPYNGSGAPYSDAQHSKTK